jgi:ATP-dependent helicase/nuclease subunit B
VRLLETGRLGEYLWIVPTAAKAKELEQRLVRMQQGKAVSDLPIMTLASFASRLLSCASPQLRVINDAESGVFLEQALRELLNTGALKYFEPRKLEGLSLVHSLPLPQGTFEMVLNTIRQLKAHGIYPHDLEREIKQALQAKGETTEVLRARDICAIYSAYEAQLGESFTDTYGQFQHLNGRYAAGPSRPESEATEHAVHDLKRAFPTVTKIVVDGFVRVERPDLHLVLTLANAKHVEVTFGIAACSDNPELFNSALELVERMKTVGFGECELPSGSKFSEDCDTFTSHLCKSIFFSEQTKIDATDRVTIFTARNKVEEVEQVARAIKHLIEKDPELLNDLSRIAISSAREYDYTDLFRETFRRYNIPVNITDRYKLEGSPLMTGVLALLEVAARGLKRRDVLRALTSPYFVFTNRRGEKLDPANLLKVVTEFKVSGDVDSWHRYLSQHWSDIDRQRLTQDLDEYEKRDLDLKFATIGKALQDIEALIELLAPFRVELKPWKFKHHLHALFSRLQFGDQLLQSSHATIAAGTLELDTRSYRAFIKLLEDLDALFSLMGIQDDELPVTFYLERLRTASLWTRFNPRFKHGHVHIASLEQISGIEFDHLFVVGMTDGVFPSAYEPQVFLMDAMQKGETRHLSEERMLFWNAILGAKKHLYLSLPVATSGGAELTPSAFLSDLKRCCDVNQGLPAELASTIYSFEELFVRAGAAMKHASTEHLEEPLKELAATGAMEVRELLNFTPGAIGAQIERRKKDVTEYRGGIDLDTLNEFEKNELRKFTTRVWSISQLERYAACPFSFFAERVLGLDQPDELEEGLDARDQGNFLHSVLREFLATRRDRGEPSLQDLTIEELEPAFTQARSIAQKHLSEMNSQHPFFQLDTERMIGRGEKEGVLERFIRKEQERGPLKTRPRFFEASFGGKTGASSESDNEIVHPEPIEIGGVKLRGKIDRIDVADDGFTIVDYKSGSSKKMKHIERGTSLQLPLYLRVAEDLLRSIHYDLKGVAALYHKVSDRESKRELGLAVKSYMTTHFEKMRGSGLIESELELQELIDRTVERTRAYVEGMTEGKFGLADKDLIKESCSYCNYYNACRVKEAKDFDVLIEPRLPSIAAE